MGAAKNRKAEIAQLKTKGKKEDLVDFMFGLGDSKAAIDMRSQMLAQVGAVIKSNISNFCYNASLGKTTKCDGIAVGGTINKELAGYHVSIGNPVLSMRIVEKIIADSKAIVDYLTYAQVGMYCDSTSQVISPAVFYAHAEGSMIVSKWKEGVIVQFIPNEVMSTIPGNNADEASQNIANFMTSK